jgi:hypothetical protein
VTHTVVLSDGERAAGDLRPGVLGAGACRHDEHDDQRDDHADPA